jgi:putative acyl-CoA dehydrogenase
MCLDVLRAVGKEPDLVKTLMGELSKLAAGDQSILVALDALTKLFQTDPSKLEALARTLTEKLILIIQACLMKDRAPQFMSDAFIATRIVQAPAISYGAFITNEIAYNQILERAFPPEGDPFFQE